MATITSRKPYSQRANSAKSECDTGTFTGNLVFSYRAAVGANTALLSIIMQDDTDTATLRPGTGRQYIVELSGMEIERMIRGALNGAAVLPPVQGALQEAGYVKAAGEAGP